MRIKGTFLDEISHDIPHQNWGEAEWDRDFGYMREAGIDTVILIRCGYRRWQTFPSRVLTAEEGCYEPPVDLVDMFLRLSDKWGMNFWFGLYDSGKYWDRGEYEQEVALNKRVIDEVWSRYGHYKSFAGWYISQECSRNTGKIVDLYVEYDELVDFLKVNKKLADRYGLECWTNSETFDRDMPIKFLPIKWEKLRLKMGLAAQAGYQNAITFEFSHFMSPQSAYLQAGHLYDRYMEYLKTLE